MCRDLIGACLRLVGGADSLGVCLKIVSADFSEGLTGVSKIGHCYLVTLPCITKDVGFNEH